MGTLRKRRKRRKARKSRRKPKPTTKHLCGAELPNGVLATKITAERYTHALCVTQVGRKDLWVVLRWSADRQKLVLEARRRAQLGDRSATVVPVETVRR